MARNRYFEDELLTYEFSGKSLKKTLRYAIPYKKILCIIIPLMVIMSFVALIPPMITRFLVDNVITSGEGMWGLNWWQTTAVLVTFLAMVAFSDIIYSYFRTVFMAKVGHGMVYSLRKDTYSKLQKLAFDYFDSRPAGKILVRLTNYLDELANIFSAAIVTFVVESVKIVMIVAWLFILKWQLALVVLATIVPMMVALYFLRRVVSRRLRTVRNKVSNRTAYIAESIQGVTVTKAFNRAKMNTDIYRTLNQDANKVWLRVIHFNELFFPVSEGFFNIGLMLVYCAVVLFSTTFSGAVALTLGTVISFINYMAMFSAPINNITNVMQQLATATSNLERVFEVMETPPSVFDAPDAYELPEIKGDVEFSNVTFAYEKDRNILENFNLSVPAGKMIALVGPTGAGKSTVINLLSRFYNINDGTISVDGHDINRVTLFSLRSQIGVMMQDSFIFSGTIMDNIRYARPQATEQQCIEAAKTVYAHDFIQKMPNGYHSATLEGGLGMSSGEKQLLSLARLVLTDPKILILDEATASIDTQTEELVKSALDIVLKGRTSFVIAHRLSTIKKADCILYIKDKGIAEAGTHEQLMESKGLYYDLVTKH